MWATAFISLILHCPTQTVRIFFSKEWNIFLIKVGTFRAIIKMASYKRVSSIDRDMKVKNMMEIPD